MRSLTLSNDLVITSSDSSLAPSLSVTHCSPSDHFSIFTKLSVDRTPFLAQINPLDSKGNCGATSNNTKLVHWPLWVGCYIWHSEVGPWRSAAPPSPLLAVPKVTAYPSTASVQITVLLYDGPLLCGFNVAIKGLSRKRNGPRNADRL